MDLATQEMERFQDLLYPRASEEKAALWGSPGRWEGAAGQTTLPYGVRAGGFGLRAHSGKRYRDRAILRLLPGHDPKTVGVGRWEI